MLGKGVDRVGFSILALIIAGVFIIATFVTVSNVKEKATSDLKSPTVKEMFRALLGNDQALVVVVTIVVFNGSLYLTQQLALY